jgi:hypothetical protein
LRGETAIPAVWLCTNAQSLIRLMPSLQKITTFAAGVLSEKDKLREQLASERAKGGG